jgi:F-box/WD-40 domain protein 7
MDMDLSFDSPVTPDDDHSTETESLIKRRKRSVLSPLSGVFGDKKKVRSAPASPLSLPSTPESEIDSPMCVPEVVETWVDQYSQLTSDDKMTALLQLMQKCDTSHLKCLKDSIDRQFKRDFISHLPKECALHILSYLEPKDLMVSSQICKRWHELCEDSILWREKCQVEGITKADINCLKKPPKTNLWKQLYLTKRRIEYNWREGKLKPIKELRGHDEHVVTCLQFYGNRIVSGSDDCTLKIWNATTGQCMQTLVGHTGGVWCSEFNGSVIVSGSTDRMLRVWDPMTGQCLHTLHGHTSTVRCMAMSGNTVVSGSRDASLRLWDLTTGKCTGILSGHVAAVRCVQFDGKKVVSGAYDFLVKVWDPKTHACLHTLQGHTNRVYSLQFDGSHIVSGSLDTYIRVWNADTGQCVHTLSGHRSLTSGMELRNNVLVSGNADSTVRIWNILSGQCLHTLEGSHCHDSAVTSLQFTEKFIVTSSDDGTVKLWDLKTGLFLRNLVKLQSGGNGGVVWRVKCTDKKLVCAVGSRNGVEDTRLLVLDFDAHS